MLHGQIPAILELLKNPDLTEQYVEPNYLRTPLYVACARGNVEIVKLLLGHPTTDVNAADNRNRTPFFVACLHGHTAVVRILAASNQVDCGRMTYHGSSPVAAACVRGTPELVSFLLTSPDVDRNTMNSIGESPLMVAYRVRNLPVLKLLLADPRVDVNKPGKNGTLLLLCVKAGDTVVFDQVIAQEYLDPNRFDSTRVTPLLLAASMGNVNIVNGLLGHPRIDVNHVSGKLTPFISACKMGHVEVVEKFLSDNRVVVAAPLEPKNSPLNWACRSKKVQVVQALLASDRVRISEQEAVDGLEGACCSGNLEIINLFVSHPRLSPCATPRAFGVGLLHACTDNNVEVIQYLIKEAQARITPDYWEKALGRLCASGNVTLAQQLLELPGLNLNPHPPGPSSSPFTLAVESGHIPVARKLIKHPRFEVNIANPGPPIVLATNHGLLGLLRKLVKKPGVNLAARDYRNRTALIAAAECGYLRVVKLLLAMQPEWNEEMLVERTEAIGKSEGIGYVRVSQILEDSINKPAVTRALLRTELFVDIEFSSEIFALVVFLCDGLFKFSEAPSAEATSTNAVRFLKIAERLPLELQMMLCNHTQGIRNQDLIPVQSREGAFKNLAKSLDWTAENGQEVEERDYPDIIDTDSENSDDDEFDDGGFDPWGDEWGGGHNIYDDEDSYDEEEDEEGYGFF